MRCCLRLSAGACRCLCACLCLATGEAGGGVIAGSGLFCCAWLQLFLTTLFEDT